jgi:hypothetical protein
MPPLHRLSVSAMQPAVGRDIEAWCSRCETGTEHTILAMVGDEVAQVRCQGCGAQHRYKPAVEGAAPARRHSTSDAARPSRRQESGGMSRDRFRRLMADRQPDEAAPYSTSLSVTAGQMIRHPSFGHGFVLAAQEGKATVLFEDGERRLVVGRA